MTCTFFFNEHLVCSYYVACMRLINKLNYLPLDMMLFFVQRLASLVQKEVPPQVLVEVVLPLPHLALVQVLDQIAARLILKVPAVSLITRRRKVQHLPNLHLTKMQLQPRKKMNPSLLRSQVMCLPLKYQLFTHLTLKMKRTGENLLSLKLQPPSHHKLKHLLPY